MASQPPISAQDPANSEQDWLDTEQASREGEGYGADGEQQVAPENILHTLLTRAEALNLAKDMKPEELTEIGSRVCREAQIDEDSRNLWKQRTQKGMDLALQESKAKTFPWPNAANIKAPLMTVSAIQFNARAYPAIVAGNDVVKAQITGADPGGHKRARADRVSAHMSWQCLTEMKEWEPQIDSMLTALPIVGCAFKKTYRDAALNRNRSDYCSAFDIIVNMAAPSLEVAPRITHEFSLYPYQIEERIRTGQFLKFDYGTVNATGEDERPNRRTDPQDEDAPHLFYEQHRRLDLDEDGYAEPYIVTVHKETEETCRITAGYDADGILVDQGTGKVIAIEMHQYFTKVPFIPNPDGGFYDVGFAWILAPLNNAVNTVINQILDAGTLANTGGGFIGSQLRLKGGTIRFNPGEFKEVDVPGGVVKDNIVPLTFPGPSEVLFKMLGLLIEMSKEVANVKDVLTGEAPPGANTPATTTLALIEQGLKVFTAIYKRIHRAMKEEFGKLYKLNCQYFDPQMYAAFTDVPEVSADDYKGDPLDIIPVSDPTMVSDMQRLARAEFLQRYIGMQGVNSMAIVQRQWEAAGIANIEELIAPQQGPPPEMLAKVAQLTAEIEQMHANTDNLKAQAIKTLAEAEGLGADKQLNIYRAMLDTISAHNDAQVAATPDGANAQGQRPPAPKNIRSPMDILGPPQPVTGQPRPSMVAAQ